MSEEFNQKIDLEDQGSQDEVVIYGAVKLSKDEISLLNLGPGFMVSKPLDIDEMEVESVVTLTKIRWGRRSKGLEEMSDQEIREHEGENPFNEEEEDLAELIESAARDVVEAESNTINMSKKRATDMKNNRNVYMPGPAPPKVEASHNTRMDVWMQNFKKFRMNHCKDDGEQSKINLSIAHQVALKSLGRKVAKLELILCEADKGKRFVAMDQETYLAMAHDHTSKDKVASTKQVRASQRLLSTTAKALINIFEVGMEQGYRNYTRCFDNAASEAEDAPTLKILPKVHKKLTDAGHPASRPVVAAATGMSSRAGDVLSDILEPLVLLSTPRHEDQSTEEVIAQLERAQKDLPESGCRDSMVGSLDVAALYPSLDQEASSEIVAQLVKETPIKFTNVNYRCIQTFLASHYDEDELKAQGILHLVPQRVHKGGRRPGPTTTELGMKFAKDSKVHTQSKWKMSDPELDLTASERRLLLSRVVKTVVKVVFANHVYQFAGVIYIQLEGGPIGLRLTSLVARIVMDRWSRSFSMKLEMAGWQVWARMKYVDDINLVISMVSRDMEWVDGALKAITCENQDAPGENKVETQEAHSMRLIKELADSIYPWLRFTSDLPEDHDSAMVPMLDLQVWVQHHPAGSGEPAGAFSHRSSAVAVPAVAGDPAAVSSQGSQQGGNPAGSGEPAGGFSQQGSLGVDARLPAVAGDPAEVNSQGPELKSNPAGSGDPAGVFSHQGCPGLQPPSPAVAGDPAVVHSQGPDQKVNPAGSDSAGEFSQLRCPGMQPPLPAVAGNPAVVHSQGPADTLAWVFFEKRTSSAKVLKASSAYTWRAKIVSMNMEVFQRLCNTTRQVTVATRVSILNQFVVKLKSSGYSKSTISGIIASGTRFYYRKLQADLEGGPPLNRRESDQDVQRKRAKIGASERWFKRRRGGLKEKEKKDATLEVWNCRRKHCQHQTTQFEVPTQQPGPFCQPHLQSLKVVQNIKDFNFSHCWKLPSSNIQNLCCFSHLSHQPLPLQPQ